MTQVILRLLNSETEEDDFSAFSVRSEGKIAIMSFLLVNCIFFLTSRFPVMLQALITNKTPFISSKVKKKNLV